MLRILLFLLIFGPRLSTVMDVIPLTSVLITFLVLVQPDVSQVPRTAAREAWLFCGAMSILFVYAIARYLTSDSPDPYQSMRFARILVNAVGVIGLISLYYSRYGARAKETIVKHLLDCLLVHSVIMLGMFVSAGFRNVINSLIVIAGDDVGTAMAKEAGTRISGLVLSWDALSGLKSLGLLMLPIMLTRGCLSFTYVVVAAPLYLFAVCISGRTGIVTFALLFPLAMAFCDLQKFHRSFLPVMLLVCLSVVVLASPLGKQVFQSIEDSAIGRVVDMFAEDQTTDPADRTGIWGTFDAISEHYFLPESVSTLVYGSGRSGRDLVHPVPADNGIILNLHNLGIVCWILLYGIAIRMLFQGWSLRKAEPIVAGSCVLAVTLMIIIDAKVAYLYARNGFSVMLVLASLAWWREIPANRATSCTVPANPRIASVQTRLS